MRMKGQEIRGSYLQLDAGLFCRCCNTFCFTQEEFFAMSFGGERPLQNHNSSAWLDSIPFDFSHFDKNDAKRAVFATIKDNQEDAEMAFRGLCYMLGYRDEDPLMRGLKELPLKGEKPSAVPTDEDHPKQRSVLIVQVRGGVSDSEITGLRLNVEALEISVDWKGMLTSFFGRKSAGSRLNMSVSIRILSRLLLNMIT